MTDKTIKFSIKDENEAEMKKNLLAVYEALNEKGYNSISRLSAISSLRTRPILLPTTTPAALSGDSTETSFFRLW